MDLGSHQKKNKDSWLAMRFGCCASKEDVDSARETLEANGMFLPCIYTFLDCELDVDF
jgi:hypothetical protein